MDQLEEAADQVVDSGELGARGGGSPPGIL
jgi:hypothetical protein